MRNVLLILVLIAATVRADDFDAANQLYDQGKFGEARQHYQGLVERGEWSANLFYNLANTNYRVGAPGLAILNYERALVLEPGHPEARANLHLLRDQVNAKVPARTWMDVAFDALSVDAWALMAAISGWSLIFSVLVPFATRRSTSAGLVFVTILAAFVLTYSAVGTWHMARDRDAAIVIAKQVEVRLAPADRAGLADVLPAGSRVRMLSERGEWVYCMLPSGGLGWVPASAVEKVRLFKS
jgi:tetratricopeptide (TPR) repeat protein